MQPRSVRSPACCCWPAAAHPVGARSGRPRRRAHRRHLVADAARLRARSTSLVMVDAALGDRPAPPARRNDAWPRRPCGREPQRERRMAPAWSALASSLTVAILCSCSCSRASQIGRALIARPAEPRRSRIDGDRRSAGGGTCATTTRCRATASRPRTRSTSRSGRPVELPCAPRRDPQLLGAGPARQEGPDPGRRSTPCISQADRPGVWRGQCAEFCGFQHAQDGALRRRRAGRRVRALAGPAAAARARAGDGCAAPGARRVHVELLRAVPCGRAARRAGGVTGPEPDPRRQPPQPRGRHAAQHARRTSRAG